MKVTILTNEYPPHIYGGAGIHVRELVAQLVKKAFVSVYCFAAEPTETVDLSADQNPFIQRIYSNLQTPDPQKDKIVSVLGNNIEMVSKVCSTDIIHSHTWYTFLAGTLLQKIANAPFCLTLHSVEAERPWKREQLGTGYNYSYWIEKTACQQADGIIAVSNEVKNAAIKHYEVSPEKITVIYNGVDIDLFTPQLKTNNQLFETYGIYPDKPYFLFVGRITKQKGFDILFSAIPHISRESQIVICASHADTPQEFSAVEKKINELINNGYSIIWIKEMLTQAQLAPLYSHATALLCTSIYEPCALVCLEAMSCGTPVIATATGGNPEIVKDNFSGFLVPLTNQAGKHFGEKANFLLDNKKSQEQFRKNARQHVLSHFSWSANGDSVFSFYQKLIQQRKNSAEK